MVQSNIGEVLMEEVEVDNGKNELSSDVKLYERTASFHQILGAKYGVRCTARPVALSTAHIHSKYSERAVKYKTN